MTVSSPQLTIAAVRCVNCRDIQQKMGHNTSWISWGLLTALRLRQTATASLAWVTSLKINTEYIKDDWEKLYGFETNKTWNNGDVQLLMHPTHPPSLVWQREWIAMACNALSWAKSDNTMLSKHTPSLKYSKSEPPTAMSHEVEMRIVQWTNLCVGSIYLEMTQRHCHWSAPSHIGTAGITVDLFVYVGGSSIALSAVHIGKSECIVVNTSHTNSQIAFVTILAIKNCVKHQQCSS